MRIKSAPNSTKAEHIKLLERVQAEKAARGIKGDPKYRNVRTPCKAGHEHASGREANRCNELHLLQKGGEIQNLTIQPAFSFELNDVSLGKYIADFEYQDARTLKWIIEDSKGFSTPKYKRDRKMMKAFFGIEVFES